MGQLDELRQDLKDERKKLKAVHKMKASEVTAVTARVDAAKEAIASTETAIADLRASLGTTASAKLETMRGDAYLRARVNARALRTTIRASLRSYKFERRKIERAFRHQLMRTSPSRGVASVLRF